MNIFYLDTNPALAAEYHCDIHVNKMAVELCQMLCTAHHVHGSYKKGMWDPAYINNPVTKWVRASAENYSYALRLMLWLTHEFEMRYRKKHNGCEALISLLLPTPPGMNYTEMTPPVLAMPDCYKSDNPVSSYRAYYIGEKNRFANWRNGAPFWWPKIEGGYLSHVKFAIAELQRGGTFAGDFGSFSNSVEEQEHGHTG